MSLPVQMQFIEAPQPGDASVMRLAQGPVPMPAEGEVLVRVMAAGVNRPDILQRKGYYPAPPSANPVLGLEVAGEVAAVGAKVTGLAAGDRVCALANGGGYAQFCAVPAAQCLPWPGGYDAIKAAALPETYFTVWANLFQHQRIRPGESLLVHGGSSGIGLTAIQLAHEFGNTVYATAGSAQKLDACLRYGASAAINYREEDFAARLQALTAGQGVDVVLDMVGAPYFQANLNSLAPDGRLVQIAVSQGGRVEQFNLAQLMLSRLTVTGSTLRARSPAHKAAIAASLRERLWPVLDAGRCAPVIDRIFPLAGAVLAHELMESSRHIGKIVLKISD
jgi:NADPH2:quinone reductase